MSVEGSRIPLADSTASTGTEKAVSSVSHPPNTVLLDPVTQEVIDPVNPASQSLQASPSVTTTAPTSLNPSSKTLDTSSSAPSVPVRTSSNSANQSSVPITASPNNAKGLAQKLSRASLKPKSRTGSPASSKKAGESAVATTGAEKPKKKSKLFSFLNCCNGSDDANNIELTPQAVPAKKTPMPQTNRDREPAPALKSNADTSQGGSGDQKRVDEQSIGGTPYSQIAAATQPQIQLPQSVEEKAEPQSKPDPTGQAPAQGKSYPDSEPRGPSALVINSDSDMGQKRDSSTLVDPKGGAETPDPSIKISEAPAIEQENMAINDRTPQQEQKDVEMDEAPPLSSEETSQPEKRQSAAQSLPLPPPPPRPSQPGREITPDQRSSTGASQEIQQWLLKPLEPRDRGKKCLVLDLDETLVHSSFKILHQADFTIPVEIEGQYHNVYVIKRPGVDEFMRRVGQLYEVVVFTASVSKYGQPLLDQLDIHHVVRHRLYRESCYNHQGNYVKDLSQIGRDLRETIIIDNSPTSYIFHPQHAVPISSWFSDAHDNELLDLIPVLEDLAGDRVRDVSLVLDVAL